MIICFSIFITTTDCTITPMCPQRHCIYFALAEPRSTLLAMSLVYQHYDAKGLCFADAGQMHLCYMCLKLCKHLLKSSRPSDAYVLVKLQNLSWYKTSFVSRQVLHLLSRLQNWICPKKGQYKTYIVSNTKIEACTRATKPDSHTLPLRQSKYLFKMKRQA